jgi:HlyD family secretion protein
MSTHKQNYYAFYITIALLAAVLVYLSTDAPIRKANLYGVVESPKIRLNHPRKVVIQEINITPGQKVKKGAVLMTLESQAIVEDLQKLVYAGQQLEAKAEKELLEFEIEQHELQLALKREETKWQQAVSGLKMSEERDLSWLKTFSEVTPADTSDAVNWQLKVIMDDYQSEVAEIQLKQSLLSKRRQLQIKAQEAEKEELFHVKQQLEAEKTSLVLKAPADGIIDNIYFMPGQTAEGFSDLLSLLPDENKFVRAYITDQTSAAGNLTRVVVQSSLEADKRTTATYVGSGGVDVLPAMLQQSPVQQSGKEVFFKLDNTEGWLQGEKVMILVQ